MGVAKGLKSAAESDFSISCSLRGGVVLWRWHGAWFS